MVEIFVSRILDNLKFSSEIELIIDQLIIFFNKNKENVDEIIEGISKFFKHETSINEIYFYKIISIFDKKLEDNNLSQIGFINKIFPLLTDKVKNLKPPKTKEENQLFDILSDFIRKLGNDTEIIEKYLDIIFDNLIKEENEFNINNKYIHINALIIFLKNSPNVSFHKIMKEPQGFKKIIFNFKHKNKIIRKLVQKLIEEFLIILFNKEKNVRIELSKKIIYDVCIKDYLDIENISEFTKHGVILALNSFAIQNPKNERHVNEFFQENHKIFINYLFSNLDNENSVIKIYIIRTLVKYCKLFPFLMNKTEQEENFSKLLNNIITLSDQVDVDEKINSELLKSFGIFSLIPEFQDIFSKNIDVIFELILNGISDCQIFNENILDCLSNIMMNYPDKFIKTIKFELYYVKFFSYGLKDIHLNFLNKLLKLYPKNSKENIQLIICILNVISFIITQKEFKFKFSQKRMSLIESENKNEVNFEKHMNSISTEYPNFILNLTKTISAPINKLVNDSDLQKYNKIGRVIKEYMKSKKEKGIKINNDINNAIKLLGFIDSKNFEKDILDFYLEKILTIPQEKEIETKKVIISLGNSSWIPKNKNQKNLNVDVIYDLKYIFEFFFNSLVVEIDTDLKLVILNILEDKRYLQFLTKDKYFNSLTPLLENDSNEISKKVVEILNKLISYDFAKINKYIKKKLNNIYTYLEISNNLHHKEKKIILLLYFVKYISKCLEGSLETIFIALIKALKKETNNENNLADKNKNENYFIIANILLVISELMNNPDYNKSSLDNYLDDIMSLCITILKDNIAYSPINEGAALHTIASILTNTNKDWKIYSDYIDLINLVTDVILKSQNKQSRLDAMQILGNIGTMNPDKLEILLDLNEVQNENELDKILEVDDENNYSDTEIVDLKNKVMAKAKNYKDKRAMNKLDISQSLLSIDIGENKYKFDFKKEIRNKNLNSTTYYTIRVLMRILLDNDYSNLNIKIIKFLREFLNVLQESDYPVIYLIMPTLLKTIDNFEIKKKLIILEIINFILENYIKESSHFIDNISQYIIGELKGKEKIFNSNNEIQTKYMYLNILDNLCTLYTKKISIYYPNIIPLLLSLLPEKLEISIDSKRKIISCLRHIGNDLNNYMSIVIPKLTDYLMSLVNNIKLISYNKNLEIMLKKEIEEENRKSNGNYIYKLFSSIFSGNSNTNNENNDDENNNNKINIDNNIEREEKELEKDIINLISFLLEKPGNLYYLERILHTLCSYMEADPSSTEDIIKIFNQILYNFKDEFLFFLPKIVKFLKKISIPYSYFLNQFIDGLNRDKILELINENYPCNKEITKSILPFIQNDSFNEKKVNSINLFDNEIKEINYEFSHKKLKNMKNHSFHSGSSKNNSSKSLPNDNSEIRAKRKALFRNISFDSLIKEFKANNCITEDDWHQWFKISSQKLFENSPSHILYLCYKYCGYDSQIIYKLYNFAFYNLWISCNDNLKSKLSENLKEILKNPKTPDDILLIILNSIEFINKEENSPMELIEFSLLGEIANSCKAHAKALYYAENEYINNDSSDELKKLINLYIELELPESSLGIYRLAQKKSKISFNNLLKETDLFLLLHQWKKAIKKLEEHQKTDKNGKFIYDLNKESDKSLLIKKALCFEGLSDWEKLIEIGDDLIKIDNEKEQENIFGKKEENIKINIPNVLSNAAFNLGEWDKLRIYSEKIKSIEDEDIIYEDNFFKAILAIKDGEYSKAENYIYIARDSIDDTIKALLNESYERAYKFLLYNENLCQLEDIIKLNKNNNINSQEYNKKKENLKIKWNRALDSKKEDIKDYQRIVSIRRIILSPEEDYLTSLELSKICRKKDKFTTCMLVLNQLKESLKNCESNIKASVGLAMGRFIHDDNDDLNHLNKAIAELENIVNSDIDKLTDSLKSKIYFYYGMWKAEKIEKNMNEYDVNYILKILKRSTKYNTNYYKAWHFYSLLNYKFFVFIKKTKNIYQNNYAINAIEGFIKSVCIGEKNTAKIFQDLLLLLNIWFQVGTEESINNLILRAINDISLENWALVIPQLLARINIANPLIRNTLIKLLKKIVSKIPRSLTYSLTLLKMSKSKAKSETASLILEEVSKEHEQLFKECELIITELNRCALFLHEKWRETFEESYKLFFKLKDIEGAAKILVELHKEMEPKPKTISEIHFHQLFRGDLKKAYQLLQDYLNYNDITYFKEAWDIYYSCWNSISSNFQEDEDIDLKNISLELFNFTQSQIEIPGIYQNRVNVEEGSVVKISSFSKNIQILNSKQHPRKIVIIGSDNKEYPFLLKGHDDLRQDERVMQLFRLINTLLSKDSDTKEKNLLIKRYPITPLSHNTGLIGWMPNCDTLNRLIKDYRHINKIELNVEYSLMTNFNPKFDTSTSMIKLETFKHSLNNTLGVDLYKILWNNSQNAENWLDIRTNYSRSLAVMSIVGYILGLGDRLPSNILLDKTSGKIIHIDFGDCFEVSMKREKFPEKVPFRLTRMLIKALEIGGIEGTFKITCENVMRVIRENKDSLNVILAAFVHDPLTSFKLLIPLFMKNVKNKNKNEVKNEDKKIKENKMMDIINKFNDNGIEKKRMGSEERQLYNEFEEKDYIESDDLNQIIKIVIERVSDKLNGTDFNKNEELKISRQIRRIISQATSHENLSQTHPGWFPFW